MTTARSSSTRTRSFTWWAVLLDAITVLGFSMGGATAHERDLWDILRITWPFGLALLLMWLLPVVHRAPVRLWPAGVVVLVGTLGIGMALRALTGGGVSGTFIPVAAALLTACFLGWRLVALLVGLLLRRR